MPVNKIDYFGETLIDLTSLTATANDVASGKTFIDKAGNILSGLMVPSGGSVKINSGTYTFSSQMAGNSSATNASYYKEIQHGLGVVPDIVIFYAPANVSQTYSMLLAMRGTATAWRSGYESICAYHGNSNSTITLSNVTTSYGISAMTNTYFRVRTYSSSNSYYWRAGTYNWIALKL